VHVASIEQAEELGQDLSDNFFLLAKAFWPGPLTLVVKKRANVSAIVSAGLDSVALRFPSHPVARKILEKTGPMAAPSANLSGSPSPTTARDVLEDLDGKIAWIVDGGQCLIGIESTVVSLLEDRPTLLRPGAISKTELEKVLGQSIEEATASTTVRSPGMKYRHYAPRAKVRLVYDPKELTGSYILSPTPSSNMRLLNEQTFYAELRRADRQGVSEIEIDCSPLLLNNRALMNRIEKAAGG
jgi:L-threonylcarbamoyladenylate synthase